MDGCSVRLRRVFVLRDRVQTGCGQGCDGLARGTDIILRSLLVTKPRHTRPALSALGVSPRDYGPFPGLLSIPTTADFLSFLAGNRREMGD